MFESEDYLLFNFILFVITIPVGTGHQKDILKTSKTYVVLHYYIRHTVANLEVDCGDLIQMGLSLPGTLAL